MCSCSRRGKERERGDGPALPSGAAVLYSCGTGSDRAPVLNFFISAAIFDVMLVGTFL
jgi:hypothetical protein